MASIAANDHASPRAPAWVCVARRRRIDRALWLIQIASSVILIGLGVGRIAGHHAGAIEAFEKVELGSWFRYLTGTVEVSGAIGLLIPRLAGLAATGLASAMVGAVLTQILILPPVGYPALPAIFGIVFGLIAWGRSYETQALLSRLRRG